MIDLLMYPIVSFVAISYVPKIRQVHLATRSTDLKMKKLISMIAAIITRIMYVNMFSFFIYVIAEHNKTLSIVITSIILMRNVKFERIVEYPIRALCIDYILIGIFIWLWTK